MNEYIVFDIETSSVNWDDLSNSQQEYLIRRAETTEEIEKIKFEMSLSPFTAQVVCIGLIFAQKNEIGELEIKAKSAFSANNAFDSDIQTEKTELADGTINITGSEKVILEKFWKTLEGHPKATLLSFNGRNFDCPFLMLRSALLRVKASRNLMQGTKFNYDRHIDLADQLTFFSGSFYGPTRRYNFDFYSQAFGIESPKSAGVDGSMVPQLFRDGKTDVIAEYCMRDVVATWELYLILREYLM